jgi:oligoendopeptidase F
VLLTEQERDRARVEPKYTWNLAEIFKDVAAWRAAKALVQAEVPHIATFAGRLGSSPQVLADALDLRARLEKDLTRLYVYASMTGDEDTRLSEPQGMQQEMQQLHAEFSAHASYMQPEILRIGGPAIEGFIAAEPRLATHAFPLRDVIRRAAHTLTDARFCHSSGT